MRFSLSGRSERRSVYSIDPPLAYAGLSVRIVAFAGDFLALVFLDVAVAIVVGFPIGLIFGLAAESIALLELGLWLIARFLYFAFWESSSYCATPGARACHLQVFDEVTGDPPTFSQASLRSVCRFFSAALFGLGWLPVFLHPKRRALHDILSGWVVVHHEPRPVVDALPAASPAEAGRVAADPMSFERLLARAGRGPTVPQERRGTVSGTSSDRVDPRCARRVLRGTSGSGSSCAEPGGLENGRLAVVERPAVRRPEGAGSAHRQPQVLWVLPFGVIFSRRFPVRFAVSSEEHPVNIHEELNRRRDEIEAEHRAAMEKLELQYEARVGEIDRLLELVSPGAGSAPGGRSRPAQQHGAPSSRGRARRPSATAPNPADSGKGGAASPAAEAATPAPTRRPRASRSAASLSTLIDKRIVAVLVKQGSMPGSEIQEMSGAKRLGPVISAWKRSARTLGFDLDTLLKRDIDEQTGEVIYRITPEGIDSLQPGADRSAPAAA